MSTERRCGIDAGKIADVKAHASQLRSGRRNKSGIFNIVTQPQWSRTNEASAIKAFSFLGISSTDIRT